MAGLETKPEAGHRIRCSKPSSPSLWSGSSSRFRFTGQWSGELIHATKDGGEVVVQSRWLAQRNTDGNHHGGSRIERQRHRAETHRSPTPPGAENGSPRHAHRGGVAHDFNNILAAIIGFTELVADHLPKGSREAHHLKRVMESSLRGRDLVRQMLIYSRKAEQEKKPLSLSSIAKETITLIRATTPTTITIKPTPSVNRDRSSQTLHRYSRSS